MKLRPFLRIDETLTLHLARPELAEAVFAVVDAQREYLRQWLPWVDPTKTVEDTQSFIRESMQHNTDGSRLTTFIMKSEEIAGSIGVVYFNRDHKKCEVGYWLREELQGEGIMTKALACFAEHLFNTKSMNRLEVLVANGNEKSKGVPLRLGFKKEGTLRQALFMYDKFYDVELFGLLKNEWQKNGGKKMF